MGREKVFGGTEKQKKRHNFKQPQKSKQPTPTPPPTPPKSGNEITKDLTLGIPLNPSASKNRLKSLLEAIPLLAIPGMDGIMAQTGVMRRRVPHTVLEELLTLTGEEKQQRRTD